MPGARISQAKHVGLARLFGVTSTLAVLLAGSAARADSRTDARDEAATYAGSASELKARATGRRVLRELAVDLGDGQAEVAIAEALPDGAIRAVVLRRTEEPDDEHGGFVEVGRSTARSAKDVARFEAKQVVGSPAPELVAIFEDPSPDESALHVSILTVAKGKVREIFFETFFLPRAGAEAPEGAVVALGDASPHFELTDLDPEGKAPDLEAIWVKEPQKLVVQGPKGPVTFVIGAYRTIHRYDAAKGAFVVAAERDLVDFLPAKPPSEVTATAQVGKIWGTAQAFWATDDDLDTAWSVEAPKGAVGQAITVRFRAPVDLSMIRVVPGCGDDADTWAAHYRLRAFRLVLSSGRRIEVNRTKLDAPMRGVTAAGEFPLDGGFGAQDLVFLAEKETVRWARLEILGLDPAIAPVGRRFDEACLAEISFH